MAPFAGSECAVCECHLGEQNELGMFPCVFVSSGYHVLLHFVAFWELALNLVRLFVCAPFGHLFVRFKPDAAP